MGAIMRHFDLTDAEVAEAAGYSKRQSVQARRNGVTGISMDDLDKLQAAFGIPVHVWLMERNDAIRWILDNGSDLPEWLTGRYLTDVAA